MTLGKNNPIIRPSQMAGITVESLLFEGGVCIHGKHILLVFQDMMITLLHTFLAYICWDVPASIKVHG